MIVSGPTSCGKTYFLKEMLRKIRAVCQPRPQRIVWLYNRWQPLYDLIQRTVEPRVEFLRGIPAGLETDGFFDPQVRNMIVLDDLMSTSAKDARINDLFTEGSHHRNLSVIALNQNLYFGKDPTQRRNCQYLVLFNNPIDQQPVATLARQMYPTQPNHFLSKFREATQKPFGYLLVDLKPCTSEYRRLRTDVLSSESDRRENDEEEARSELDGEELDRESMPPSNFSQTETNANDKDDREDLIACRDCGLVFAHIEGLEDHVESGCSAEADPDEPAAKRRRTVMRQTWWDLFRSQFKDKWRDQIRESRKKYRKEGYSFSEAIAMAKNDLLPEIRKFMRQIATDLFVNLEMLKDDEVYSKIMETARKFHFEDDMDWKEAITMAVKMRKQLFEKIVTPYEAKDYDSDDDDGSDQDD